MPVDPSNPDTFEDADEPFDDSGHPLRETSPETPDADAAEQLADLQEQQDAPLIEGSLDEVNPADAVEQARVVEINEEDYR